MEQARASNWGDASGASVSGHALAGCLLAALLTACNSSGAGSPGADSSGFAASSSPAVLSARQSRIVEHLRVTTADNRRVSLYLGYVPGTKPTRLVVFCHGATHTIEEAWRPAVENTIRPDTAVVASNYRGDELLSADFTPFPILAGAQDTNAATQLALARFPSIATVYLFGVSLGGGVSGTAIAESTKLTADGASLYHYWIDLEGVSNLAEYWLPVAVFAQASPLAAALLRGIEADPGGTPYEVPQEYARRSPALHAPEMKAGGLRAAVIVHGVNDGIVPHDQSRDMATALVLAGVPVHFFTVLRDSDGQVSGTGDRFAGGGVDGTATGLVTGAFGLDNPNDTFGLNLTGHGDEKDYAHPVMRTGFEQLKKMLDGTYVVEPYNETIVDDQGAP